MRIGIDTETTGLPGKGHPVYITQLAVVVDGKPKTYLLRIPEDAHYSQEAELITGLTRERLEAEGLDPAKVLGSLAKAFATKWRGAEVIAHNADFDRAILEENMAEHVGFEAAQLVKGLDWKCTLKAARKIWRGKPNKLADVCERLGITFDESEAHAADYDARKALEVYEAILAGKHKQPAPLKAEVVGDIIKPSQIKAPAVTLDAAPLVTAAEQVVEQLAGYVADAQRWADEIDVTEDNEADVVEAVARLRKAQRAADKHKKRLTDALGPPKREIDRLFREGVARPLDEAAKVAGAKLDELAAEVRKRRLAEQEAAKAAALEAAKAGDADKAEAELDKAEAPVTKDVKTEGATSRVKVTYSAAAVTDAGKVPTQFLKPDLRAVQAYVDAYVVQHDGELSPQQLEALRAELPGIQVDEVVARNVRARR